MQRIPMLLTGGSVLLLQAACPVQPPATTDGTTEPGTSTSRGTDALTSTSTTSTVITTTDAATTTTGGTTTGGDSTTTGEGDTETPVDPGCTYPGSTSGGADTMDVAPECACVSGTQVTCGEPLCPKITGKCDAFGYDELCHGTWEYEEDALDCAIQVAAAGTEGTLAWRFTPDGGFSEHDGFLVIVGGRRVIRQDLESVDLDYSVSDTELWNLKDPAWFEGCLELDTFCERLDCFFAGTEGDALSLCQDGFDYTY